MYPIIRLFSVARRASNEEALTVGACVETTLRCMPWDIDVYLELNNGRVLTLYDIGRTDLATRVGLVDALKQHRWGLVVAGSTVRYRKRIRMWDKITIKSQLAGVDDRWFYVRQSMWVNGEPCNSVLLRTGVTKRGRTLTTDTVCEALGASASELALSGWEKAWAELDDQRPWPPEELT